MMPHCRTRFHLLSWNKAPLILKTSGNSIQLAGTFLQRMNLSDSRLAQQAHLSSVPETASRQSKAPLSSRGSLEPVAFGSVDNSPASEKGPAPWLRRRGAILLFVVRASYAMPCAAHSRTLFAQYCDDTITSSGNSRNEYVARNSEATACICIGP